MPQKAKILSHYNIQNIQNIQHFCHDRKSHLNQYENNQTLFNKMVKTPLIQSGSC